MANCSYCGAEVTKESGFCAQCGQLMDPQDKEKEETLVTPASVEPTAKEALDAPTKSSVKRTSLFKRIGTSKVIVIGMIAVLGVAGIVFKAVRHNALVKSTVAFNQAQIDTENGQLDQALTDLGRVSRGDTHFKDAQKQETDINRAKEIIALMNNFVQGSSKYDSVLSAYWNDYNNSIEPLNTAWKDYTLYYATDLQPLLGNAEPAVSALNTDSGNLSRVVGKLSLYLGTARTNPLVSGYDTSVLSLNYTDSSNQANAMSEAISNELSSFQDNSFVYGTVSNSIADTNTANRKLKDDQTKVDQASAEFVGYLTGIIKRLLGGEINMENIVNFGRANFQVSEAPGKSRKSPACSSPSPSSATQSTGSSTVASNSNVHYSNARYGFSIDYPSNFSLQDTPPINGDGINIYTTNKHAAIAIYGSNVLDEDVNHFYQQELKAHANVTYKIQEGNWYVVSWVDGGTIGYTKGIVGKGSMNAFEIEYPKTEQQVYGPVIDRLSASFRTPGVDTAH